jgi:hypothetical protein
VEIMAISNIPGSVGHNFTPEYQISAIPYIRSGVINTYDNGTPLIVNNDDVYVVELPKITQWIQFKAAAALSVYFSKTDAQSGKNGIVLNTDRTFPLDIRCVNLYFNDDDDGKELEIVAGLTSIDRKEFIDVVETFLEAQP